MPGLPTHAFKEFIFSVHLQQVIRELLLSAEIQVNKSLHMFQHLMLLMNYLHITNIRTLGYICDSVFLYFAAVEVDMYQPEPLYRASL